jgi:hypothetical protein
MGDYLRSADPQNSLMRHAVPDTVSPDLFHVEKSAPDVSIQLFNSS